MTKLGFYTTTVAAIGYLGATAGSVSAQAAQGAGVLPPPPVAEEGDHDAVLAKSSFEGDSLAFDDGDIIIGAEAGAANLRTPGVKFMRLESGGMIMNRGFGVRDPSTTATHLSAEASLGLSVLDGMFGDSWAPARARMFLGVDYLSGENYRSTPLVSATPGYQLGINDGAGGGFLLFPGFSDLENVGQRNKFDRHSYNFGLRWEVPMPEGDSLNNEPARAGPASSFDFGLRVNYSGIEQKQTFEAVTNGGTLPFSQRTSIDEDIYGVGIEAGYKVRLAEGLIPGGYARVSGGVSLNHHDADAKGELNVIGSNTFNIDNEATKLDWKLGAEFGIRNRGVDFKIGYSYENFAVSEVNFRDAAPASLGTDRAESHTIRVGMNIQFGGGMTSIDPPPPN